MSQSFKKNGNKYPGIMDLAMSFLKRKVVTNEDGTMSNQNTQQYIQSHLELLGFEAKDVITGYKGIISSVSFDLYGCVQAVITPPVNKDGVIETGNWFDATRVKILGKKPVMEVPDFSKGHIAAGRKGAADKPAPKC